tara:strand:- start:1543 stop:2622 length:1080 start_codon:yes stop_codon:yes gene_type:complete
MTDLLSVRDLRVSFGTETGVAEVLDRVNFNIGRGEIVGLVGESGCGKTTLARAILGILPENSARIDSGSIKFKGLNLLNLSREKLSRDVRGHTITFIPQDPFTSFNPVFTIGSQIRELMRWKSPQRTDTDLARQSSRWKHSSYSKARVKKDREQVLELLSAVQLPEPEEILRKYPHEVSGGQRQRLMIAQALLPEPELIIADEPTTALDVTIQAQILKLLRRLARERNIAVLFTTHDLGTTYEICDRITVMYAGQEMESAPSDDFFQRPTHPYTKSLLESLPTDRDNLRGIPGDIPTLVSPPSGCRFHPRCTRADQNCADMRPAANSVSTNHSVRCFHPITWSQDGHPSDDYHNTLGPG